MLPLFPGARQFNQRQLCLRTDSITNITHLILFIHTMAATIDNDDPLVFHIAPEQRQLLSTSSPEEFERTFQDFSSKVKYAFDNKGVIVIRGLLDDELLGRLEIDSQHILDNTTPASTRFAGLTFGPVFSDTAFREVALMSAIPRFVATLLMDMNGAVGDTSNSTSLHLLKDAFLAKKGEKGCCGWHVDDAGFWPTSAKSRPGVNAWIAIDDIPSSIGGGLAVSPSSHRAPWRNRAYEAIGSTKLYPDEGLVPGTPLYDKLMKSKVPGSGYGKTCNMHEEDPDLADMLDESRKVFNFLKGDVLFHTRWLFHRSMPLTSDGENYFQGLGKEPTFKRYSIRYEYSDSRLLMGLNAEFAVMLNPDSKGKALEEVNRAEGPFYPKCWPEAVSKNQIKHMDKLVTEKFPSAEAKRKEFFMMMMKDSKK